MFRFTIRDVLWLTVVVALAFTVVLRTRQHRQEMSRLQLILALEEQMSRKLQQLGEINAILNSPQADPFARDDAERTAKLVEAIAERTEKLKAKPN